MHKGMHKVFDKRPTPPNVKGNICRIVDGNVGALSDQGWQADICPEMKWYVWYVLASRPFWEGAALFAVSLLLPWSLWLLFWLLSLLSLSLMLCYVDFRLNQDNQDCYVYP
jgi:hypothetical protein